MFKLQDLENQNGFIRWAIYYKGDEHIVNTGKKDENGRPVTRTTRKNTQTVGDWVGGSRHPHTMIGDKLKGATRFEVHHKLNNGEIKVLFTQEDPQGVTIEWKVLSGMTNQNGLNKKLPVYIQGIKVIPQENVKREFLVLEEA